MKPGLHIDQPARYRIRVQGRLDSRWASWLHTSNLRVTRSNLHSPMTTFIAEFADQAALHGCLTQLRDLGLPLLLVKYLGPPVPSADQPEIV